jgi:hypothetical protein
MTGPDPSAADPFPRRLTRLIAVIGGICLVGSMASLLLPGDRPDETALADSTSRSALGHRALVDLLRGQGIPVTVSRHKTVRRASDASLLLVLEPQPDQIGSGGRDLDALVDGSVCPVLVVLPKWKAVTPPGYGPGKSLSDVHRLPAEEVGRVLRAVDREARLVVGANEAPTGWSGVPPDAPPVLPDLQLVTGKEWRPILGAGGAFLAAVRTSGPKAVALLSDPDLIENHGLHRQPNPGIVVDLVQRLRKGDRPVLLDETLHGLTIPESFWAQLFELPLWLVTLQGAFAVALLLWAGMRRFGPPLPAPLPYTPGKSFLIAHTARLLEAGGHHGESLMRYATLVSEAAARKLHGDARGGAMQSMAGLESEARGIATRRADTRVLLPVAQRLARLRQEIVHGSDVRTGAR